VKETVIFDTNIHTYIHTYIQLYNLNYCNSIERSHFSEGDGHAAGQESLRLVWTPKVQTVFTRARHLTLF